MREGCRPSRELSTTIVVCRSVMSQAVDQDEVGRINSVLALFGAVR